MKIKSESTTYAIRLIDGDFIREDEVGGDSPKILEFPSTHKARDFRKTLENPQAFVIVKLSELEE